MANARPLLKANTGVLESDLTSKSPGGSPVVPAKVWSGATIGRESDRLPWVVAALVVSKTGGGPHANINANNAVMNSPAVVPRISHSLNLGARCTFRINRSLHLNFCILQPPGRSLNFNLGKANLKFKPGVREIGGLDSKTPRDSTSTPRNGGGGRQFRPQVTRRGKAGTARLIFSRAFASITKCFPDSPSAEGP